MIDKCIWCQKEFEKPTKPFTIRVDIVSVAGIRFHMCCWEEFLNKTIIKLVGDIKWK